MVNTDTRENIENLPEAMVLAISAWASLKSGLDQDGCCGGAAIDGPSGLALGLQLSPVLGSHLSDLQESVRVDRKGRGTATAMVHICCTSAMC